MQEAAKAVGASLYGYRYIKTVLLFLKKKCKLNTSVTVEDKVPNYFFVKMKVSVLKIFTWSHFCPANLLTSTNNNQ